MSTITESQLAEIIIRTMQAHDIEPDVDYTHPAGCDWGSYEAWEYEGCRSVKGGWAVKQGDNATTTYWLEEDEPTEVDATEAWVGDTGYYDDPDLLIEAQIAASGEVPEATEGGSRYGIVQITNYYGPTSQYRLMRGRDLPLTEDDDNAGDRDDILDWPTLAEAQAALDNIQAGPDILGHNESDHDAQIVCLDESPHKVADNG